jgi:hypothetical protein
MPINNASMNDPTKNLNIKKLGMNKKIEVNEPKKVSTK